jgi:DnaJ-class molecular chaperone
MTTFKDIDAANFHIKHIEKVCHEHYDKITHLESMIPHVISVVRDECGVCEGRGDCVGRHQSPCPTCLGEGKIAVVCDGCEGEGVAHNGLTDQDVDCPICHCHGYATELVPKGPGDEVWNEGRCRQICFVGVDGFLVFKEGNCIRGNGKVSECFADAFTAETLKGKL